MRMKERLRRGEEGFTLVELLMVLAILAILVAVVLANFTGLLSGSKATANSAEVNIVQTAVDVRMANESLADYTDVGDSTETNIMGDAGFRLYPTYMRSPTSNCIYTVDENNGAVSQFSCP